MPGPCVFAQYMSLCSGGILEVWFGSGGCSYRNSVLERTDCGKASTNLRESYTAHITSAWLFALSGHFTSVKGSHTND